MRYYVLSFNTKTPAQATIKQYETEAAAVSKLGGTADADCTRVLVTDDKASLAAVPTVALLTIYNDIRGTTVKKFADRDAAVTQTLRTIQIMDGRQPTVEPSAPESPKNEDTTVATKTKRAAKKTSAKKTTPTGEPRTPRLIEYKPAARTKIKQVREGTKLAQLIDLLAEPGGVLLKDAEKKLSKTGQPINLRSWLSFSLNTQSGYGVTSKVEGNDLRLKIVYPEGMRKPLDHKPKAGSAKAE